MEPVCVTTIPELIRGILFRLPVWYQECGSFHGRRLPVSGGADLVCVSRPHRLQHLVPNTVDENLSHSGLDSEITYQFVLANDAASEDNDVPEIVFMVRPVGLRVQ